MFNTLALKQQQQNQTSGRVNDLNTDHYIAALWLESLGFGFYADAILTNTTHLNISRAKESKGEQSYLSQSFSVGTHVSEDDQDMFLTLVGQVLCCSQRQAGSDDTLDAS